MNSCLFAWIPSGFLLLAGDCRWTLASLSSFPLSLRTPRHAAPVLVAMVTRASRAVQERDAERKTERGEKGKGLEGFTLPFL